tara:strand:+ start:392 stop:1081 length:690 start_codon:yes stop_codon:yes gene_type:complete
MKKLKEDNSNLPAGAEYASNAPWREGENTKDAIEPSEYKMEILSFDSSNGYAIFKDKPSGVDYVFNAEIVDLDEFEEYADREEIFHGRDEDGDPIIEYGEWELDEDVIDRYVNDNIKHMSIGKGLSSWEDGDCELVELDSELEEELGLKTNTIKESKNAIRMVVREVISESFEDYDMSFLKKLKLKLKGVTEEQLKYNVENGLPWDWRGSKEGFYEKMEPRRNYSGSNE